MKTQKDLGNEGRVVAVSEFNPGLKLQRWQ